MNFLIRTFDSLASTNLTAREWISTGAEPGTVIRALTQTGGRGRQGRSWVSLPGALLISVILRPGGAPTLLPRIGFQAAVAAVLAAESFGARALGIKWPNDLIVRSPSDPTQPLPWRKWGGILVESGTDRDGLWAVLGMGLNIPPVPQDVFAPPLAFGAVSDALPRPLDADAFLCALLDHLGPIWDAGQDLRTSEASWKDVLDEWRRRDVLVGRSISAEQYPGRQGTIVGSACGVNESGALGIRTENGIQWVEAGDTHLLI